MPECSIKCGYCCKNSFYWRDAVSNKFLHKYNFGNKNDYNECPFLQKDGCSLPRKNRPKACLSYLCGDAKEKVRENK